MRFSATADALAALQLLEASHAATILLDATADTTASQALANSLGCQLWLDPDLGPGSEIELTPPHSNAQSQLTAGPTVGVVTSGTTGTPKVVWHTWRSLFGPTRSASAPSPPRWFMSYRPNLYAGLQVLVQTIRDAGTLVVPPDTNDPEELAEFAARCQVTHASGTPAFWRRWTTFAHRSTLSHIPLQQITLGGEAVDQGLLDRLAELFPAARLTHIYATTEAGRCFAVSDGRAGFPATWLTTPPAGIELRVEEGELWVRPSHGGRLAGPLADTQPDDGWLATGDLVRADGDRLVFDGRRVEMINVGGYKVSPLKVESIVRSVNGVSEARVYPISSSLAGQLVACDLVVAPNVDPDSVRHAVQQACQAQLARPELPRLLRVVDQIATANSGKIIRRAD